LQDLRLPCNHGVLSCDNTPETPLRKALQSALHDGMRRQLLKVLDRRFVGVSAGTYARASMPCPRLSGRKMPALGLSPDRGQG
jgi:hypothetical protein